MSAVGVIPARYRASRFPGKPLAKILGIPMIQRVFEGARQATRLRDVLVATDDERIVEACAGFGAEALLTSPDHPTGTDRLAEVARGLPDDIVVNVQGDEPLIQGAVIDTAVAALEDDPEVPVATLVHPLSAEAALDPNRVKVVLDRHGRALYFSRNLIPARREGQPAPPYWQHVGLYAYRRDFLLAFVELEPTPAEQAEALEQLRVLEHGYSIRAAVVENWVSVPVDTPEDLARVEEVLRTRSPRTPGAGPS
jgi:3-deoxy-manno-octulosonate cytidylyltransferase (CMP-KDO synthetase)